MASTDGLDQENYVGIGGYGGGHSAAFAAGYNCGFSGLVSVGFISPDS